MVARLARIVASLLCLGGILAGTLWVLADDWPALRGSASPTVTPTPLVAPAEYVQGALQIGAQSVRLTLVNAGTTPITHLAFSFTARAIGQGGSFQAWASNAAVSSPVTTSLLLPTRPGERWRIAGAVPSGGSVLVTMLLGAPLHFAPGSHATLTFFDGARALRTETGAPATVSALVDDTRATAF